MKRLLCRTIGHKETKVTYGTRADGSRFYYSHPNGKQKACRRCRLVLSERIGR